MYDTLICLKGRSSFVVYYINLSPSLSLYSTLRYANRAKNIKNKPRINEDPKDALLRQYREEIEKLKEMLGGGNPSLVQPRDRGEEQGYDWEAEKEAIRQEYEKKMANLRLQYDQ